MMKIKSMYPKSQNSSGHERKSGALPADLELPYSTDAERALLSSLLIDGSALASIEEKIRPDDFYHRAHQRIFTVFVELSALGKPVDLVVLNDELVSRGWLGECGGLDYLLELQGSIPCLGMIDQYTKIIKDKSILRTLIIDCADAIRMASNPDGTSVEQILDRIENQIFKLSGAVSGRTFSRFGDLLKLTFDRIAQLSSKKSHVTGVTTGFRDLDHMTCGMQPGDLMILAARPSMGKTALALNMALNAWASGAPVGIFSLEMSWEQLVLRILSSESGVSQQRVRSATISSEEWIELTNAAARIDSAEIYIDDTPGITLMELRAKARRMKAKHNIKFLVIDYLQLITTDGRQENRNQEISAISRSLKALAKELEVPILALSQLSRSLESRVDKRPILSDLRESGAIEQDGDLIMFIYRDVVYNKETENPDFCELIIGKQRNGPIGTVGLRFDSETTHFENTTQSHD